MNTGRWDAFARSVPSIGARLLSRRLLPGMGPVGVGGHRWGRPMRMPAGRAPHPVKRHTGVAPGVCRRGMARLLQGLRPGQPERGSPWLPVVCQPGVPDVNR